MTVQRDGDRHSERYRSEHLAHPVSARVPAEPSPAEDHARVGVRPYWPYRVASTRARMWRCPMTRSRPADLSALLSTAVEQALRAPSVHNTSRGGGGSRRTGRAARRPGPPSHRDRPGPARPRVELRRRPAPPAGHACRTRPARPRAPATRSRELRSPRQHRPPPRPARCARGCGSRRRCRPCWSTGPPGSARRFPARAASACWGSRLPPCAP